MLLTRAATIHAQYTSQDVYLLQGAVQGLRGRVSDQEIPY